MSDYELKNSKFFFFKDSQFYFRVYLNNCMSYNEKEAKTLNFWIISVIDYINISQMFKRLHLVFKLNSLLRHCSNLTCPRITYLTSWVQGENESCNLFASYKTFDGIYLSAELIKMRHWHTHKENPDQSVLQSLVNLKRIIPH